MTEKRTVQVPDGKGGWATAEGTVLPGAKVDAERQARAQQQQFINEAGALTERLAKFAVVYCREGGLTPEHAAFAVALLCVNLRNDFPAENGGPAGFDKQAIAAQDYYDSVVE